MKKKSGMIAFPAVPHEVHAGKPTHAGDPLGEFSMETGGERERQAGQPANSHRRPRAMLTPERRQRLIIALAVLGIVQIPFVVMWAVEYGKGIDVNASSGNVIIDTQPSGIEVKVDGKIVGNAPLQVPLAPGKRTIELRHDGLTRSFPLVVNVGETVHQRFEFVPSPSMAPAAAKSGTLQVATDPTRVTVVVDGAVKGQSPLSINDLAAGEHNVAVRFASGTVERRIQVQPGAIASVQFAMPSPRGALSGWVNVDVPVSLRISEDGRLLGTTDIDRLMLPVGDHTLDFGSEELGFRTQRTVTVSPAATSTVQIDLPRASLSINARPWAEAWVDGERIGETPIGNLSRPIGRHEIVLRHPELGERKTSVVVTLNQPARVSVDLRQR